MLKVEKEDLIELEAWLESLFELVSFRIVPDTQELWEKSSQFKKLVRQRKDIQEQIDKYINEHG